MKLSDGGCRREKETLTRLYFNFGEKGAGVGCVCEGIDLTFASVISPMRLLMLSAAVPNFAALSAAQSRPLLLALNA
jgi:hypothetical protein